LLDLKETDFLLEQITGKGKKTETNQFLIPFDNINKTIVQVEF
jgi:hypothetical protein